MVVALHHYGMSVASVNTLSRRIRAIAEEAQRDPLNRLIVVGDNYDAPEEAPWRLTGGRSAHRSAIASRCRSSHDGAAPAAPHEVRDGVRHRPRSMSARRDGCSWRGREGLGLARPDRPPPARPQRPRPCGRAALAASAHCARRAAVAAVACAHAGVRPTPPGVRLVLQASGPRALWSGWRSKRTSFLKHQLGPCGPSTWRGERRDCAGSG